MILTSRFNGLLLLNASSVRGRLLDDVKR
ncbi:leu operon leader peptide [Pseudocitrobacter vendiensis]|uniref:leu operon leader peptide n=1 Tax=Pseudocitrobacter vendiensis TaxID=2488306 RepID=A0ABM9F6W0_9ENTR|nr:leu operon attenuator peptide [Pseudocitrobacter vendiensis]